MPALLSRAIYFLLFLKAKQKTHHKTGYITFLIDVAENSGSSFSLRFEFSRLTHMQHSKVSILMMHTCSGTNNHCLWKKHMI
jgi:hypothetical protein